VFSLHGRAMSFKIASWSQARTRSLIKRFWTFFYRHSTRRSWIQRH